MVLEYTTLGRRYCTKILFFGSVMVQHLTTLDSMYDTGILYMGSRSDTGNSSFRFEEWYWNSILWVQGVVREFFI